MEAGRVSVAKTSYVPFPEHLGRLVKTKYSVRHLSTPVGHPVGEIGLIVRCWPVSSDPHARPFYDVLLGTSIHTLDIGLINIFKKNSV